MMTLSKNLKRKIYEFNWPIFMLVSLLASVGFAMLYSAGDGAEPWMMRQVYRYIFGVTVLFTVSFTRLEFWVKHAYTIYFICLLSLIIVEVKGIVGMGAQRWVDIGFLKIQPSEMMKIGMILALARYFHYVNLQQDKQMRLLYFPLLLIAMPALLILRQPDLGTTILIVMSALSIIFLAGISIWKVATVSASVLFSLPVFWYLLKDYQRQRILTFLDPESDPFSTGYHIIQSKIALGSGGFFGKGFMEGTQGSLDFLPEKQTDFIFSILCEEFGFIGGTLLIIGFLIIIFYCYLVGMTCKNAFSRYLSMGMATLIFLYFFINIAMVTGLVPVVGQPLPLVSYGGASMLTFMFGLGLVFCADMNRNNYLGRALRN